MNAWHNWSRRLHCRPAAVHTPDSLGELREAVASAKSVRFVGSGHSFSELVPTNATMISLDEMAGLESVDPATGRAVVKAGTTIAVLGPLLAKHGLALANQGDIDRQTVAGAVSTATHGTGRSLGCIASRVTGLRIVLANGDVREFGSDDELLHGAAVSLGALGGAVAYELQCDPSYLLRERVWSAPLDELLEQWESLRDGHRHFEFFAVPFTGFGLAKTLDIVDEAEPDQPAERPDDGDLAVLLEINRKDPATARQVFRKALAAAEPRTWTGPSHEIFPSERNDLFNEMEYAVPLDRGVDCLREVLQAIESADLPVVFPIEFRTVAADDLWLSPFHARESAVLSVHQDAALPPEPVFDVAEPILREHGGRPHWGKMHSMRADDLNPLYPSWEQFRALRRDLDPDGKFLNPHLAQLFGETSQPGEEL